MSFVIFVVKSITKSVLIWGTCLVSVVDKDMPKRRKTINLGVLRPHTIKVRTSTSHLLVV